MAEAFEGLMGVRQIVDDIVIYDKDVESHLAHVRQLPRATDFLEQGQVRIRPTKGHICRVPAVARGLPDRFINYRGNNKFPNTCQLNQSPILLWFS